MPFDAVTKLDQPTGPVGTLSSDRKAPPSKGTKKMPGKKKRLVCAPRPAMKARGRR